MSKSIVEIFGTLLSRRKKEEGRRKNVYTFSFLAIIILCLIRWIYLMAGKLMAEKI
ncbi:hypothetical protein [Kamptonema sp. UHCC 0994]|uniref:hypothetical protein n=1 Tax=Kamptonema sp. UHCC 0994 TaxID=3031329 RepID=UPI0023B8A49C|nr:hypothetical protein [Kamptonema sp. UHCC 0994]MDF0555289.1 hypothetical protein [Kamptonema sp. UHCC 0994]